MAAPNAVPYDQILLSASKTRRDYRLSLALLVAGIVVVTTFYGYLFWASSTGGYPTSIGTGLAISTIGGVGFILITIGAIFAGVNWSLLRKRQRGG